MKRRRMLLAGVAVGATVLAALMSADKPQPGKLLVLEWAAKAADDKPPIAVLIEFGLKDAAPTKWTGTAKVTGAKVVRREGYRFRPSAGDKLVEPDGWEVTTHRGLRVPPKQPAVSKQEPIATVGVVLHLADVTDDARLRINVRDGDAAQAADIPLKPILAGKPEPLAGGVIRLITTATPVAAGKTEDDFPAACYGPDGTLWVAWVGYHVKDENRRIEQRPYPAQPENFKDLYTPEFRDQVFVRAYRDGKWGEPIAVTDDRQDIVRCAIAAEGDGTVWVVYGAHRNGRYALHARQINDTGKAQPPRLEPEVRLSEEKPGAINPVACTDQNGHIRLTYMTWWPGDGDLPMLTGSDRVEGKWVSNGLHYSRGSRTWYPAAAAGLRGEMITAYDSGGGGDYDIIIYRFLSLNASVGNTPICESARYEARPSLAFDTKGRLWVAYEEGPELWGKDYGALDADDGEPLYSNRSVRVLCLELAEDGKIRQTHRAAELPTSDVAKPKIPFDGARYERATRYAYPQIGIDGKGRIWLTYRQKFGSRYSTHPGSYWLTFARRLDGDKWTEPVEVHHSCGLLDHRPVLLPHKNGGIRIVHNTDGRYTTPETIDNQVYMSYLDLPGEPIEPKLVPHEAGEKDPKLVKRAKDEAEAVDRIRKYRVEAGGKSLQLLRGEFHRHTEISWDGGPDGSLEDMFRYGIDAAKFDWIGNGDHDSGGGREYTWWLIQKFTDAYTVPGRFTGMFTYERSVAYPHGHRNCMFAKRGVRTLPRLAEMDAANRVAGVHADDTKMLYRYLKELGGICAVHTSATSMGTDWRDNDPEVEPVVEIYQGDRMSYEMQAAPRAGYDPKSEKFPPNIAGWYPDGFVDNALGKKGYKLGFQASSDHWSTHISYCIVLAEKNDREAIVAAMRKRHCYGATDDIICDIRSGQHIMGDSFATDAAPKLEIAVIGTKPLAWVDVLRDSKLVESFRPGVAEFRRAWTDPKPEAGTHYYYVRVVQQDDEIAWTSPMWIEYKK